MRKKAQLKFLLLMIVGLLLFVPTVLKGCQLLAFSSKQKENYNALGTTIETVEDRETASTNFYLEDKSIVVGFAKGSNRFELHSYIYHTLAPNIDQITFKFNRPISKCPIDNACICLCKNSYQGLQEDSPESTECQKPVCRSFDNVNFLSEKVLQYEDSKPKLAMKGGFLYFKSKNSVPQESLALSTPTLYIQRYKNIVDVCTKSPCMDANTKASIDKEFAVSEFNNFVRKYEECKAKINGDCGSVTAALYGHYFLYYKKSDEQSGGFYLVKGEYAYPFEQMEKIRGRDGRDVYYTATIFYKNENTEHPTLKLLSGTSGLNVKDSKVILGLEQSS